MNAPGNYTFYIKDGNGCIVSTPYTLNQELLLQATLTQDLTCTGAAVITYGNLVQAIINFVIISLFIFVVLRAAEKAKKKEEAAPAAPAGPSQEELLTQIRDLLKK